MNLLSVEISDLMSHISKVDESLQVEDQTYISNALTHCKFAKQFKLMGQYENSIFHFRKAAKIIEQLYEVRKERHPDYQILLAPFYFRIGDGLSTYVELNTNEMGALKPLELPTDPDDVEQEEEVKQEEASVVEEQAEDEPVIKDVVPDQIDSSAKQEANPLVAAEDQMELDEIAEDIFSNFGLALQIIKDFKEG